MNLLELEERIKKCMKGLSNNENDSALALLIIAAQLLKLNELMELIILGDGAMDVRVYQGEGQTFSVNEPGKK